MSSRPRSRGRAGPATDPWNFWVMSVQGSISMTGEESSRELDLSADMGADRITDDWKITMGFEIEHSREDFDLDEEEPLRAMRDERDFDGLIARSVNDHWSVGGRASIDSSTFDNIAIRLFTGPAIEFNLFPYSEYTRRQLRFGYAVGPYFARYREQTLLFTFRDAMAQQQASVTLDQREQWGSLQAEARILDVSSGRLALPPPARRRRQRAAGARSFTVDRGQHEPASRSDFDSPPGLTDEEILLRLRRLRSGYEYNLQIGLTYTFGSIFNTIVNPRFGQ